MTAKNEMKMSVFLLFVICISTAAASYAYFTAGINGTEINNIELSSATMGSATANSGSPITLLVTGDIMRQENSDPSVPAATSFNTEPIELTLSTSETGGELVCVYDIFYVPTVEFVNSIENTTNAKEFTIKGTSSLKGEVISEVNLGNISEELLLVENAETTLTGVLKQLTESWTFTTAFYNQPFNQDDNADKIFGGKIVLKNLDCKNTFTY